MNLFQINVGGRPTLGETVHLLAVVVINLAVLAAFSFVIAACVTAGIEAAL